MIVVPLTVIFLAILVVLSLAYFTIPSFLLFKVKVRTVSGRKVKDSVDIVKGQWLFGSCLDLLRMSHEQIFLFLRENATKYHNTYLIYAFNYPILNIVTPEHAEQVLNNPQVSRKSMMYRPIKEFVRTGLLTSHGKKWHTRRKLITPTFHFGILKEFFEVFREETENIIHIINRKHINAPISLDEVVAKFTLNTICETAMGVKLSKVNNGEDYRQNVDRLQSYLVNRSINPWFYNDTIYKLFGKKEICDGYLEKVHNFSSSIVNQRRLDFLNRNMTNTNNEKEDSESIHKRRNAMLDTLLLAQMQGHNMTHLDICEEVDTFTFEGYETTSIALTFSLLMLATHPDVQKKVLEEIDEITDDITALSITDYNQFKYLECVLKETMRLYPSVPFISRGIFEETVVGDLILPKYSTVNILIYDLHRNPKYFPDPEKFDPNRFQPGNSENRHAFAYVPFSAGLRNCIGQKFAMLEMKVFLVNIIKNFEILPVTRRSDVRFKVSLTLSTVESIEVQFRKRERHVAGVQCFPVACS